jgi:hypothetical protein
MKNTTRKKVGRPRLYKPEYAELAHELALLGLTDKQIAEHIGISETVINEWKKNHPVFGVALKKGKVVADAKVAASLYERARGYAHPAVKIFNTPEGPVLVDYVERYPPDTQAASLWLRNRQSALWRDRIENALTGANGGPVEIKGELAIDPGEAYFRMLGGKK